LGIAISAAAQRCNHPSGKRISAEPTRYEHLGRYGLLGWCRLLLNEVDQPIDLLVKARTSHPRVWWVHLVLAGSLALKGDLDGAKTALAGSLRIKPMVNSIGQFLVYFPRGSNGTLQDRL
jgi:hypothetical protein